MVFVLARVRLHLRCFGVFFFFSWGGGNLVTNICRNNFKEIYRLFDLIFIKSLDNITGICLKDFFFLCIKINEKRKTIQKIKLTSFCYKGGASISLPPSLSLSLSLKKRKRVNSISPHRLPFFILLNFIQNLIHKHTSLTLTKYKIKTLAENETYKYLGILEADTIKQVEMKKKIQKEYLRRTRKLLETKLKSRNLIKGINTWAVPLVRYSGPFLKWTRDEVK